MRRLLLANSDKSYGYSVNGLPLIRNGPITAFRRQLIVATPRVERITMDAQNDLQETLVTLTADIVAAHVSNNSVAVSD